MGHSVSKVGKQRVLPAAARPGGGRPTEHVKVGENKGSSSSSSRPIPPNMCVYRLNNGYFTRWWERPTIIGQSKQDGPSQVQQQPRNKNSEDGMSLSLRWTCVLRERAKGKPNRWPLSGASHIRTASCVAGAGSYDGCFVVKLAGRAETDDIAARPWAAGRVVCRGCGSAGDPCKICEHAQCGHGCARGQLREWARKGDDEGMFLFFSTGLVKSWKKKL